MRALSLASLVAISWFFVRVARRGVTPYWPISLLLMTAALALFWWAVSATRSRPLTLAFDSDMPMFLYNNGPYQRIRHPFYASYILFWFATSLATYGTVQWMVPVVMAAAYVMAARQEEHKFLGSSLRDDYRRYQARTSMLLPLNLRRQRPGPRRK
jgi:protein-S-isoprenylcysteine O-methyltransferase Ste14